MHKFAKPTEKTWGWVGLAAFPIFSLLLATMAHGEVLPVFVDSGQSQDGYNSEQMAAISGGTVTEIMKTGSGTLVSKGIEGRRDTFDFAGAYQGVRTKHDPSQRHRIVEFYRATAGVAVDDKDLPWSVKPSHPVTVDDLKRGFGSHAVGQGRVSVHTEENPGVAWPVCRLRTLESVICRFAENPAETLIFLAPGRPCETKYDGFRPFRDAPPA